MAAISFAATTTDRLALFDVRTTSAASAKATSSGDSTFDFSMASKMGSSTSM
jgi:hypothetical protein